MAQMVRGTRSIICQANLRQGSSDTGLHNGVLKPQLLRAKRNILFDGRAEQLVVRILEQQPYLMANGLNRLWSDRLAKDPNGSVQARLVRQEAVQMKQHSGFAGAIGT